MRRDYEVLKDRMVTSEFERCESSTDVCIKVVRDRLYKSMFPELHRLCNVPFTIPFGTVLPERGFSVLCRVKTKSWNRIGASLLKYLLNISINGPEELSEEDASKIADKWLLAKSRRAVGSRTVEVEEDSSVESGEEFDVQVAAEENFRFVL